MAKGMLEEETKLKFTNIYVSQETVASPGR